MARVTLLLFCFLLYSVHAGKVYMLFECACMLSIYIVFVRPDVHGFDLSLLLQLP